MTTLDHRYGRTRTRRRLGRWGAVAVAAALVLAALAWALWSGFGGAGATLDTVTTAVTVRNAGVTEVRWSISGRQGARLVCAIEATDRQGVVVGLQEVVVPASDQSTRSGDTVVRTVRVASTGLIHSCRDA